MKDIKLELSPNFTLEDIRKVRDYSYEMTKDMTPEERSAYRKERSKVALEHYYKVLAEVQAEQNIAADLVEPYITRSSAVNN